MEKQFSFDFGTGEEKLKAGSTKPKTKIEFFGEPEVKSKQTFNEPSRPNIDSHPIILVSGGYTYSIRKFNGRTIVELLDAKYKPSSKTEMHLGL